MRALNRCRIAVCGFVFALGQNLIAQTPPDVSGTYLFTGAECVSSTGDSYSVTIPGYSDKFTIQGQDFNETEVFGKCTQSVRGTFALQPTGALSLAGISSVPNGSCTDPVEIVAKSSSGQEEKAPQSRTFVDGQAVTYKGSLVFGTGTVTVVSPSPSSSGTVCLLKYEKQ